MSSTEATLGSRFGVGQQLPVYTVRAHNASEASENKIHDNDVARQYGFRGGLVPGVTDYAYMTRPIAEALGAPWLEHGSMSARFLKPLYEGEETSIVATVTAANDDGVSFDVNAFNAEGELCAAGTASLLATPPAAPPPDAVPFAVRLPERPEASPESLAIGTVLGTLESAFSHEAHHNAYLAQIADDLSLYRAGDAPAHSGFTIRFANSALHENVRVGPWIHVSSDVQHFGLLCDGDLLTTRAVVTDLFERKGHEFVDLDVLILANETRPVMRVQHRAIYKVRRVDGVGG
jgi:acyl dehydratase